MKIKIVLFLLCLVSLNVMGQGTIQRNKKQTTQNVTPKPTPKPAPKPKPTPIPKPTASPKYGWVYEYDNGRAKAYNNKTDKYGYIDTKGNVVFPFRYSYIGPFFDGVADVGADNSKKEYKKGLCDYNGNEIVPCVYDSYSFGYGQGNDRIHIFKNNGKYGILDNKGNVIVPFVYDYMKYPSEGLICVEKGGKYGFIDKYGRIIIPFIYDYAYSFSEGIAQVRKDKLYGYIDMNNNLVLPFDEYGLGSSSGCHDGLIRTCKNNKYAYYNKQGECVIPYSKTTGYGYMDDFSEGLAVVGRNGKYGYINKNGDVVIPLMYEGQNCNEFHEGLACIQPEYCVDKWGFIDKNNNVVIPFIYEMFGEFSEGLARVKKNGKYGYIDKRGNTVIPFIYNNAAKFENGKAWVELYNGSGSYQGGVSREEFYIDKSGKRVY